MGRVIYTEEQKQRLLKDVKDLINQGYSIDKATRKVGISHVTYRIWAGLTKRTTQKKKTPTLTTFSLPDSLPMSASDTEVKVTINGSTLTLAATNAAFLAQVIRGML